MNVGIEISPLTQGCPWHIQTYSILLVPHFFCEKTPTLAKKLILTTFPRFFLFARLIWLGSIWTRKQSPLEIKF